MSLWFCNSGERLKPSIVEMLSQTTLAALFLAAMGGLAVGRIGSRGQRSCSITPWTLTFLTERPSAPSLFFSFSPRFCFHAQL